ncbi:TATA box-binding protein-associated factor RNA polymerase I subunit D isoform 2-T2 [Discoglossus pictus]
MKMAEVRNDSTNTDHTAAQTSHLVMESSDLEFPQSQDLFSDLGTNIPPANAPADQDDVAIHSDGSSAQDSLFETQHVFTPMRIKKTRASEKVIRPPPSPTTSEDTTDCERRHKKFNLKEIVELHFNKKKTRRKKRKARRKYVVSVKVKKKYSKKLPTISVQERRRRVRHRGIRFPFTATKYLPYKSYFAYEQAVFGGFLHYIENLKYDQHLQNSLSSLDVGDKETNEDVETRRHKYLDDDGPISPISEPGENDQEEPNVYDAKIVENNAFILNCKVPSKKTWCLKKKKKT